MYQYEAESDCDSWDTNSDISSSSSTVDNHRSHNKRLPHSTGHQGNNHNKYYLNRLPHSTGNLQLDAAMNNSRCASPIIFNPLLQVC